LIKYRIGPLLYSFDLRFLIKRISSNRNLKHAVQSRETPEAMQSRRQKSPHLVQHFSTHRLFPWFKQNCSRLTVREFVQLHPRTAEVVKCAAELYNDEFSQLHLVIGTIWQYLEARARTGRCRAAPTAPRPPKSKATTELSPSRIKTSYTRLVFFMKLERKRNTR